MKIILDTNVFISGIFFSGPPFQILQAWKERKIQFVLSQEIVKEYQRVARVLADKYPKANLHVHKDSVAKAASFTTHAVRVHQDHT